MPPRGPRRAPGALRQPLQGVSWPSAETPQPSREPVYRAMVMPRGPMRLRRVPRPYRYHHVVAAPTLPALTMVGIRIDLYESDGVTKVAAGPVLNALECSYGEHLSQLDSFSFSLPLNDPMAVECSRGRIVQIFIGGEGYVFQGRIEVITDQPGDRGVAVISGRSVAVELAMLSVRFGLTFDETDAFATTVGLFLAGTSWVAGSLDAPPLTTYSRAIVGVKRFAGLLKIAETFGWHVRPDGRTRRLDMGSFGDNSGLRFTNWEGPVSPRLRENPSVVLLQAATQTTDISTQVKRVIAVGQEQGISGDKLTLELATETGPAVDSEADYDGTDFWFIEDPDPLNTGSEDIITVRDIVPLSLSTADKIRAANALWGVAKTYLDRRSSPLKTYTIAPINLKHIVDGVDTFRVGQKARVQYRGWDLNRQGQKRQYLDIDADLWLMGYQRRVQSDGRSDWQFSVSSVPREVPTETSMLVDLYERFDASVTAPRATFTWGGTPPIGALTPNGAQIVAPLGAQVGYYYVPEIVGGNPADEDLYGYDSGSAIVSFGGEPYADKRFGARSVAGTEESSIIGVASADGFGLPSFLIQGVTTKDGGHTGDLLFYYDPTRQRFVLTLDGAGFGMNKVTGSGYLVMPAAATGIDPANSGSAWTNGAWSEVLASTAEADSIIGIIYGWDALDNLTRVEAEIDIGTGAAAAEVAVATIPAFKQAINPGSGVSTDANDFSADQRPVMFPAPIEVASSTRISVRVRSSDTGREPSDIRLIYAKAAELVTR